MEPSTLPWPGDRRTGEQAGEQTGEQAGGQTGKQTGEQVSGQADGQTVGQTDRQTGKSDRVSVKSGEASWTESEKELMAEEGGGLTVKGAGRDEPVENHLPEKAAQVFSPAVKVVTSPSSRRGSEAFWETQSEKGSFLGRQDPSKDYNQHGIQYNWTKGPPPAKCEYAYPSPACLLPDSLSPVCVTCQVGRAVAAGTP